MGTVEEDDANFLCELAQGHTYAIELGTFTGQFSTAILKGLNPDGRLLTLDTFLGSSGGSIIQGLARLQQLKALFERLTPYEGRYSVMVGEFSQAAHWIANASVDFVFIDGAHDYASVINDIRLFRPKLKPGGKLVGHDFAQPASKCDPVKLRRYSTSDDPYEGLHYGVIRAVSEFFPHCEHRNRFWWVHL